MRYNYKFDPILTSVISLNGVGMEEENKSRILVVGIGPILEPGVRKTGGQCLRTWHLVKSLLDAGHEISLFTIPIPDADIDILTTSLMENKCHGDFPYIQINRHEPSVIVPVINDAIRDFRPDALLGINTFPSRVLADTDNDLPLWVDLNGYVMVEGQTKCRLYNNDAELLHFWEQELKIVQRADKFSVVSEPQKYALLGELAIAGRLNRWNFDWEFVHWLPNAVNEMYRDIQSSHQHVLRGSVVPENAFVLLWSGGYNTWTDVDFLYESLNQIMGELPDLHFVSTGGMVDGHDELSYARFQELVAKSSFRDRFHLQGWLPADQVPAYYRESDLGINIDSFNYETIFGARNRLVNMMAAGLAVLTTRGTEISAIIERENIGMTFPIGDHERLASCIHRAAANPDETRAMGLRGRDYVLREFSYEATTRHLQKWAHSPKASCDNVEKKERNSRCLNEVEGLILEIVSGNIYGLRHAREELKRIRSRPVYKLYRKLKGLVKKQR